MSPLSDIRTNIKPAAGKRKLSERLLNIAFPGFDELKFVMMLVVGLTLCAVNENFGHTVSLQLQDAQNLSLLIVVFIILLIIATQEKLPDDLKAWSAVFYYGFFAWIAYAALDHQNAQVHGGSLIAHINLWLIYLLLAIAIVRAVVALIMVRNDQLNKLIARSFSDTQYTTRGFMIGVLASVAVTFMLGNYYHTAAQAAVLSLVVANAGLALLMPRFGKRWKF